MRVNCEINKEKISEEKISEEKISEEKISEEKTVKKNVSKKSCIRKYLGMGLLSSVIIAESVVIIIGLYCDATQKELKVARNNLSKTYTSNLESTQSLNNIMSTMNNSGIEIYYDTEGLLNELNSVSYISISDYHLSQQSVKLTGELTNDVSEDSVEVSENTATYAIEELEEIVSKYTNISYIVNQNFYVADNKVNFDIYWSVCYE